MAICLSQSFLTAALQRGRHVRVQYCGYVPDSGNIGSHSRKLADQDTDGGLGEEDNGGGELLYNRAWRQHNRNSLGGMQEPRKEKASKE